MGAIIAILADVVSRIPQMVSLGMDVSSLISGMRGAVDNIGSQVSKTDAEFAKLDADVKAYEDDFDAAVATRLAE